VAKVDILAFAALKDVDGLAY